MFPKADSDPQVGGPTATSAPNKMYTDRRFLISSDTESVGLLQAAGGISERPQEVKEALARQPDRPLLASKSSWFSRGSPFDPMGGRSSLIAHLPIMAARDAVAGLARSYSAG
jgi:hypothetical protein